MSAATLEPITTPPSTEGSTLYLIYNKVNPLIPDPNLIELVRVLPGFGKIDPFPIGVPAYNVYEPMLETLAKARHTIPGSVLKGKCLYILLRENMTGLDEDTRKHYLVVATREGVVKEWNTSRSFNPSRLDLPYREFILYQSGLLGEVAASIRG